MRCATMLCLFGRTRNNYVTTGFIRLSNAAESSATSGYVVVKERFGQKEEPFKRNEEGAKKKPSFLQAVDLIDATWKHIYYYYTNL